MEWCGCNFGTFESHEAYIEVGVKQRWVDVLEREKCESYAIHNVHVWGFLFNYLPQLLRCQHLLICFCIPLIKASPMLISWKTVVIHFFDESNEHGLTIVIAVTWSNSKVCERNIKASRM